MHQALPYKTWHTTSLNLPRPAPLSNITSPSTTRVRKAQDNMKRVVDENAVVVVCRRGCCMSHVVRRLLLGLGVNPTVHEVDEQDEVGVIDEVEKIRQTGGGGGSGCGASFPAVFIGGRWFGGLDRVMATHITGELTPILREAGALWL